jgi:hypothetical protein
MKLSELSGITPYVAFIIIIKVVFILSAIAYAIMTHTPDVDLRREDRAGLIKQQTEFVFIVSMAILLLSHFRPGHTICPDSTTSVLFFIFGIVILLTAKWQLFINESPIISGIRKVLNKYAKL